ncbi:hypothetical protein UMNK88_1735 [Escherichia coli UMNK88]|nr:hypothetical protein UMNK88_1735 [Escherichia coli UMNK88]
MVIAPKKAVTAPVTYAHASRILSNIDLPPTKQKPGAVPGNYNFALLGNILIYLFFMRDYGYKSPTLRQYL